MKYGKFGFIRGKKGWLRPSADVGYLHEESPTQGWGASIDLD
jgi:hypothetical protein